MRAQASRRIGAGGRKHVARSMVSVDRLRVVRRERRAGLRGARRYTAKRRPLGRLVLRRDLRLSRLNVAGIVQIVRPWTITGLFEPDEIGLHLGSGHRRIGGLGKHECRRAQRRSNQYGLDQSFHDGPL